jgi:hypothetical protein
VVEDVRSVIQNLVAPSLKSLAIRLDSIDRESRLRDENLASRLSYAEKDAKFRDELTHLKIEALSAKMDAQYASILFNLNLDKRVGILERDKQSVA